MTEPVVVAPLLPANVLDTLYDDTAASSYRAQYDPIRHSTLEALSILQLPLAKDLFGHGDGDNEHLMHVASDDVSYMDFLTAHVKRLLHRNPQDGDDFMTSRRRSQLLHIGLAALFAFLQSNVTGPPLVFTPADVIIPVVLKKDQFALDTLRKRIIRSLSVDGEAVYHLTPNVELFCVAKAVLVDANVLLLGGPLIARTARMRVNFLHQKMLSNVTGTLQTLIYDDLAEIEKAVFMEGTSAAKDKAKFLLERATIHMHHGFDIKARGDLGKAAEETGLEFALTGKLGKRTKFQNRDISQLVVLAKSADEQHGSKLVEPVRAERHPPQPTGPTKLDLNDDTLLESISFAEEDVNASAATVTVLDESFLPPSLAFIDPSNQPKLNPLDSANLLAIASAITNTSPDHGLTREETLPYATRVLEDSSNWQIYTQALLVRSRIEAHRSRTVERSVLQLQVLVDQIIADTTSSGAGVTRESSDRNHTTFLPKPAKSESVSAGERLEYIWTLSFPTRWSLEAELASRWMSLGGLRTALEIYERLEMWAEVALCYAATEREDKAKLIVRRQLYEPNSKDTQNENDTFEGPELSPLPVDAPRLFCILGDLDADPVMFERAWEISGRRSARAQRSLARHYLTAKPPILHKAEEAYRKSLQIDHLNHDAWFAIGCVQLQLERWDDAVQSFTRTVQLDDSDAEAWSNLAAALLRISSSFHLHTASEAVPPISDSHGSNVEDKPIKDLHKHKRSALSALHQAARLKRSDYRIWDNILTVAASIPPPETPFRDIIMAQRQVIEILGPTKGEKCVDIGILSMLVDYMCQNFTYDECLVPIKKAAEKNGSTPSQQQQECVIRSGSIPGQILSLVDQNVVPLITHSGSLWLLVSRVEQFRQRPSKALETHEKAWRAVVASCTQGAFQMGDQEKWLKVVDATERLVRDGYAKLGGMERERPERSVEAEAEGEREREHVAKDWRFKARSAVRGIMGKGKQFWEDTPGWNRLKQLALEVSPGGQHYP